mmetsp:Transcript_43813/g.105699  ORF Transcript_43813/g.105699 Transcript_43813/m.105699 type:complete len:124 (+) Transcript_43813:32-403(+)
MVVSTWIAHAIVFLLASPHSDQNNGFTYIACYKPALTLCSLQSDNERSKRKNRDPRQTLADLTLPVTEHGLHIVGRLDRDSEGLLLLTEAEDGRVNMDCSCHCLSSCVTPLRPKQWLHLHCLL